MIVLNPDYDWIANFPQSWVSSGKIITGLIIIHNWAAIVWIVKKEIPDCGRIVRIQKGRFGVQQAAEQMIDLSKNVQNSTRNIVIAKYATYASPNGAWKQTTLTN